MSVLGSPQGLYLPAAAHALAALLVLLLPHVQQHPVADLQLRSPLSDAEAPSKPSAAAAAATATAAAACGSTAAAATTGTAATTTEAVDRGQMELFGIRRLLKEIGDLLLHIACISSKDSSYTASDPCRLATCASSLGCCSTVAPSRCCSSTNAGACSRSCSLASSTVCSKDRSSSFSTVGAAEETGAGLAQLQCKSQYQQQQAGMQQRSLFAVYGQLLGVLSRRAAGVQLLQQEGLLPLLLLLAGAKSSACAAALAAIVPLLSLQFAATREVAAEALHQGPPDLQLAILAHWSCQCCCCGNMQKQQQPQQVPEKQEQPAQAQTAEWVWQLQLLVQLQQKDSLEGFLPIGVSQQVQLLLQQLLQRHGAAAAECILQQLDKEGPGALSRAPGPLKLQLLRCSEGLRVLAVDGWLQRQLKWQSVLLWGDTTAVAESAGAAAGASGAGQVEQQRVQQQPILAQQVFGGGLARMYYSIADEVQLLHWVNKDVCLGFRI